MKKRALVEAALFQSSEPLTVKQLADLVDAQEDETARILDELEEEMAGEGKGIEIFERNGRYEMRVKDRYADEVAHLTPHADLSRGLLKVLALIVYKQPITQSDIVKTIGNRTYSYVQELEDRGLITTEKFGRTKKIELTEHFMDYFGIESRKELLEKFEEQKEEPEDEVTEKVEDWMAAFVERHG